ncbi:uncharacterized protein EI97DRAFT_457904 [Westerdykella ornata]|uniref:Uncharacterized protein n=1 Tax=Westerdykella ornata TaxID=318751 RepID=A0A6A6JNG6_WESOR|nr:uncharacterized protein EI97DRAFT_457904 [Westerdykella ornata]KAF2277196.1 hypothetical protein EI97DRAFT_457904 [Westerdykella ornata]
MISTSRQLAVADNIVYLWPTFAGFVKAQSTHITAATREPSDPKPPTMIAAHPPNLSEYRNRMLEVWKEALSNGCRPEELIPEEMQDHFLTKLRNAESLVKDLQEREKLLEAEKAELERALADEKQKVEDMPEEHKQLIVDKQQLERHVECLRIALESEEKRAINFEKRYKAVTERLVVADNHKAKVEAQAAEIERLEDKVHRLYEEKDQLHELNNDLVNKNESGFREQLGHLREALHEADQREHQLQNEIMSLKRIETVYNELVASLESQQLLTEDQMVKEKVHNRQNAQLNIAAVSEIKTITKYFIFALKALNSHATIIETLLGGSNKYLWLPDDHNKNMQDAADQLAGFVDIRTAIDDEYDPDPEEYEETLEEVDKAVQVFLGKLQRKPDRWASFMAKFSPGKLQGGTRFCAASL